MTVHSFENGIFGTPRLHCHPTWYREAGYISTGFTKQWWFDYLPPWSDEDEQLFNDYTVTVNYPDRNITQTVIDYDGDAGLPIQGDHLCYSREKFSVCDFEASVCDQNPCGLHGRCVPGCSDFECVCSDGFEGETCHLDAVDDCSSTPCQNGGTCIDEVSTGALAVDGYTCLCAVGLHGEECEQANGLYSENEYTLYNPQTESCAGYGIELNVVPARQSGWARGTAFWLIADQPNASDVIIHETGDSLGWYE